MQQRLEELYKESIKLIDSNPNIMTNAIPDHLLNVWLYNGKIVPEPPIEMTFAASVYMYAYENYGGKIYDPSIDRHRFERLQYLLATEYLCRRVGAKLHPRKVFDFSMDNTPLNVDVKRHQLQSFQELAATLIPLRWRCN